MTLSDSVKSCLDNYATMQGRAPRSEYWWFVLFYVLLLFVVTILFAVIGAFLGGVAGATLAASIGYVLVILMFFVPMICVTVRRLHDTGHCGIWYFISLVPLIGPLWFLYLMVKDSDYENEYGLPIY